MARVFLENVSKVYDGNVKAVDCMTLDVADEEFMVIVRRPQAFLFDEPLSNLDAKLCLTTRAELKALHRRLQTTSIYVTHDQAEAMTLGDRICVMYDGVVQQVARPKETTHSLPVWVLVPLFMSMTASRYP